MTMTNNQRRMFKAGQELAEQYPGYCLENALEYLSFEEIESLANAEDGKFFEAGFDGREPEWVAAIRYGEIPASGRSTNWATGNAEGGVSCLKIIRKASDRDVIHPVYELQGTEKITVEGWYFGDQGSDGEPLLIDAKKVS